MLIIQRPTIEALGDEVDNRQAFGIGPLDPGFGHTLGNSLRRTLLSSIPGAAATRVPVFGTDGTYRLKIMVQNTAPYGWWLWTHPTGGGAGSGMLYMDPMKAGSFPAEDVDPYVFGFNNANSAYAYFASVIAAEGTPPGTGYCGGYLAKGLAGEAWVNIPGSFPSNSGNRPFYGGGVATNAHNGKDESFALQYIRSAALAAPNGCKGVSSLFRWVGGSRSNGETMNKTTAKDKIVMGHVLADWDGTDPEL